MTAKEKRLTVRQLEALSAALEEIDAQFYMVGLGADADDEIAEGAEGAQGKEENTQSAEADVDDGDDSYSDSDSDGMFDREDIEVAIDAFLSDLHRAKMIKKNKKGKLPSFSGVFQVLFGDAAITDRARDFEDFVEGYFGFVAYEQMCLARDQFVEIQSIVRSELDNAKKS